MPDFQLIPANFSFRTNKDTGEKRPTVEVNVPVPSAEGIAQALVHEDPKVVALVVETIQGLVISHVRSYVDEDKDFNQETLDKLVAEGKFTLEALANLPKSERNVLTKEELEAFAKAYIAVMPELTGKSVERVTAAAGLYVERYKRAAGDNAVLEILKQQLEVFINNAPEEVVLEHSKALTYLSNKVDELLSVKVTAEAL